MGESHGAQGGPGQSIVRRGVRGGVAAVVGILVMDPVTQVIYDRRSPEVVEREAAAMPEGKGAAQMAAIKGGRALGLELTEPQSGVAASALHWAIGVVPAAVFYGLLGRRLAGLGPVRGLVFGLGLFAVADEGVNTAFGFAGPPSTYPLETHLRGLVGHAVLGVVTDAVYSGISDR